MADTLAGVAELGLQNHPGNVRLGGLRRRALDALREKNQQLNPCKFIIYSEMAEAELPPVE